MRKEVTYTIIITVLAIVVAIIGSTYAYYSLVATGSNKNVSTSSKKYEIVYRGGTNIDSSNCTMNVVASKEGGCSTTVEFGLGSGVDVAVKGNLFINVDSISDELKIAGFKWEVYKVTGNTETRLSYGDFSSIPASNQIQILSNETLSTTVGQYKIYFWIDGNLTGNSVANGSFRGYIVASTETLTGIVNNS